MPSCSSIIGSAAAQQGWDDSAASTVLLNFLDKMVSEGKISTDDFFDFVQETVEDEILSAEG